MADELHPAGETQTSDEPLKAGSEQAQMDTSNLFFGSYEHSLDGKGRIIIPAGYRKALGEKFTIGPTKDFMGIALYPRAVWVGLLADMRRLNQRKPVVQQYMNQFNKLSYPDSESDAQGRLLLPMKLRTRMLGDVKDVEISGDFDHVRIVDLAKANSDDESFQLNREQIMEILGDLEQ